MGSPAIIRTGDWQHSVSVSYTLADKDVVDGKCRRVTSYESNSHTEPENPAAQGLEEVYAQVRSASGIPFRYSRGDRKKHQNSHTFYLAYEGPLPAASPKEVKVDITITEQFVLPVEDRAVLRGYDEYADLTDDSKIRVYALDEIGVEKTVALTDRVRNEPRDLYDVWFLARGFVAERCGGYGVAHRAHGGGT